MMFILDTNDIGTAMFAKGQKVDSDIALWYKRISHVNYQRLQELQTKQVVFGFPKFSGRRDQVFEAYQLGKQLWLPFPNEQNHSLKKLDLIHSDVWLSTQNVSWGGSRYFVSFIDDYGRHTNHIIHPLQIRKHQWKLTQHIVVDHCWKKKSNDAEKIAYVYIEAVQGIL